MSIMIHDSFCHTRFGQNIFDHLIQETSEIPEDLTQLELIARWSKKTSDYSNIVCTQDLYPPLVKVCNRQISSLFPISFQSLQACICETPTWFLAGSESNKSLVACKLSRSTEGFMIHDSELDAVILTQPQESLEALYSFDLSEPIYSREQACLLALLGARYLMQSPVFRCSRVGVV